MLAITMAPLSHTDLIAWLRLARTDGVGPVGHRQLVRRYGSAQAALEALPDLARRAGRADPLRVCPKGEAERELAALELLGGRMLAACEHGYPDLLRATDAAPPVLSVLGDAAALGHARQPIAIVGSRNASANGVRFAERLAAELGAAGHMVVSGLARGIDGAAHRGALGTGTVGCVAGGVDIQYPREHADLQRRIADSGAVVSEVRLGTRPTARHFPRRNRIISGLTLGVVVVEAAPRSGSLITARLAGEQGREVMAVPGHPSDGRAQGCNALLRDGATLIRDAGDVLEAVSSVHRYEVQAETAPYEPPQPLENTDDSELDAARSQLIAALTPTPTPVDDLLADCQFSPSVVALVLLEMELSGTAERHPGNRISLVA